MSRLVRRMKARRARLGSGPAYPVSLRCGGCIDGQELCCWMPNGKCFQRACGPKRNPASSSHLPASAGHMGMRAANPVCQPIQTKMGCSTIYVRGRYECSCPKKITAPDSGRQHPSQSRFRASSRPRPGFPIGAHRVVRSEADTCYKVCCSLHEPEGSDCAGAGKITKPGTWDCMKRCLSLPPKKPNPMAAVRAMSGMPSSSALRRAGYPPGATAKSTCGRHMYECGRWPMPGGGKSVSICCPYIGTPLPGAPGRPRPRRLRNGCYHPGKLNHAGRAVVACRMGNPRLAAMGGTRGPVEHCPEGVICGWNPDGSPICAKSVSQCGTLTSKAQSGRARPGRLLRRARARRRNPGPNGEAIPVAPFCGADACTSKSCGPCDESAYAFPGRVQTVLDALEQMRAGIDYAVATASDGERAMRAPGAFPFADPSIAVLTKPGGPQPPPALPTDAWDLCWGPAAVALPSQNRQIVPGGTP